MANRLATYDFTNSSTISNAQDRMMYPWDEWFDGSIWRIEQGVDFKTHPLMMERIIRTRATARKVKIVLRHEPTDESNPFGFIVFRRTDVSAPETSLVETQPHTGVTPTKRPVRVRSN